MRYLFYGRNMDVIKAEMKDLPVVMQIIDCGRRIMRENGNMKQWVDGYPTEEIVIGDIKQGKCYLCVDGEVPVGTFVFTTDGEPTYARIYEGKWLAPDKPYGVIHRMASNGEVRGVFSAAIEFCSNQSRNLRIDTHRDNHIMRHNLQKHGFCYCGIIYLDNGDKRLAYQRITGM